MSWYCIHTRPLKEACAAAYIEATLGVETYLPLLKLHKTIRRVRQVVTNPLFPRYFFCSFNASTQFRAIRYAPDVISVVSSGDNPVIVRETIIDSLKNWSGDTGNVVTFPQPLNPGDLVEITEGPMRGIQAVILHERSDRERVSVLLSMLEYGAQLTIDRSQLARVG